MKLAHFGCCFPSFLHKTSNHIQTGTIMEHGASEGDCHSILKVQEGPQQQQPLDSVSAEGSKQKGNNTLTLFGICGFVNKAAGYSRAGCQQPPKLFAWLLAGETIG
jgi:hypothetical protein